jgi:hypothetical protein
MVLFAPGIDLTFNITGRFWLSGNREGRTHMRTMATSPSPDSFDRDGNRYVPKHGIRIALHVSLVATCAYWLFAFISDKQWLEHNPGPGAGSVPIPLWISIVGIALPFGLYLLSVLLLSTRSEELIAGGAGVAAGMSPFGLTFSVAAFLGMGMRFALSPTPFFLPMATAVLVVFIGSAWIAVSALRIAKVSWGAFLAGAGVSFFGLAIFVHKAMGS